MAISVAAEAAETSSMVASSRKVKAKHLIGKSYRDLVKIVESLGGVSFFVTYLYA